MTIENTQNKPYNKNMEWKITNAGIAVDEAILAAAMVGSVGLFGAVAVPWGTVFGAGSNKILGEVEAIEAANHAFFRQYHKWPMEMTNGSWSNNAAALVTRRALRFPYQNMQNFYSSLENVPYDINGRSVSLRHSYGPGGRILQGPSNVEGYKMQIVFENMPLSKVKEMDKELDKKSDLDKGRLQARFRDGYVDMVYYSNKI